jgi:cytosine/uracil/thiamine/allantoin permease
MRHTMDGPTQMSMSSPSNSEIGERKVFHQLPERSVNYLFLWLADGANVGTMQQAGAIVSLGLSWREASVVM